MQDEIRFHVRPLRWPADLPLLHRWFTMDRAHFWGMTRYSAEQIEEVYRSILRSGHAEVWLGSADGEAPAFLFESYDPAREEVGKHFPVRAGDLGMHCFIGPPQGPAMRGFSRRVFRSVLSFLFQRAEVARIVVEPDIANAKVHRLNQEMGFVLHRTVKLTQKRAALAFCSRQDFFALHPFSPVPKEIFE